MNAISPYRIFFPLGFCFGLWGIIVWVFYWKGMIANPAEIHSSVVVGGFLFSFITGFLLTATPKYLNTYEARFYEVVSMIFIVITMVVLLILEQFTAFIGVECIGFILLARFVLVRFVNRKANAYPFYIFLIAGLFIGILSTSVFFMNKLVPISDSVMEFSKRLYYQGIVLCFVIGVGSSLIPMILGTVQFQVIQVSNKQSEFPFLSSITTPIWWLLVLFIGSFVLESFLVSSLGAVLKAVVVSYIMFKLWKLYAYPKVNTRMTVSLWVSGWFIVIGLWLLVIFPTLYVHAAHMLYIGGFSLLTLLIASRVTMAHGGYGLKSEINSNILYVVLAFVLLAAITRITAIFWPEIYISHLAYAALSFGTALLVWGVFYIQKILVLKNDIK